jgi:cbb3-type cytochrome oxidase cytochrome c subunit
VTSPSLRPGTMRTVLLSIGATGAIVASAMLSGSFSAVASSPLPVFHEMHLASALAPQAKPEARRGWFVRYATPEETKDRNATGAPALVPAPAFMLAAGETVHPGVPANTFVARYDAELTITQRGEYRFGADVEGGTLRIMVFGGSLAREFIYTINQPTKPDGAMSDWVELPVGTVNVQYTFTRTGTPPTPARLRALWEQKFSGPGVGFRREPLGPTPVTVPPLRAEQASLAAILERGRTLLGDFNCMSCHASTHTDTRTHPAVPTRAAPNLAGIGSRASREWLAMYIANPGALKPGVAMPDLFGTTAKDTADAAAIAAYLSSATDDSGPFEDEPLATEAPGLAAGKRLYQTLGCVACHESHQSGDPAYGQKGSAPHPHGDLKGKWRASSLSKFLRDPLKHRPSGRMPSFNLNQEESDFLATYLVTTWNGGSGGGTAQSTPTKADIENGRKAFVARGCVSCHAAPEDGLEAKPSTTANRAKALSALRVDPKPGSKQRGCLDPADAASPRFVFASGDVEALAGAINESKRWTTAAAPVDRALRTLESLSCVACHEHPGIGSGEGGVRDHVNPLFTTNAETLTEDESRLPPQLTGVGNKLTTEWMHRVLTEGARARPYMAARMPVFGSQHTASLAHSLHAMSGVKPDTDRPEPVSDNQAREFGRRLVGARGLACISCHVVGENPPTGTPGPDITAFAARIRYEWYDTYMHAPRRFKPTTRMMAFYPDNKGTITEIYAGDSRKQIDAMWSYFNMGGMAPLPEGISTSGNSLVLTPSSRPMVVRTFLKEAATRGIAVGYPDAMGGVHFAFSAEEVRLTDAWTGAFLDASGAWAGRGGNISGTTGTMFWRAPRGPSIVLGGKPDTWPASQHLLGEPKGILENAAPETATDSPHRVRFRGYRLLEDGTPVFAYSLGGGSSAAVTIEEQFSPMSGLAPGTHGIRRAFTIKGLTGTAWHNAGTGAVKVASAEGGKLTTEAVGDETWILIEPAAGAGAVGFVTEVRP